MNNALPMAMEYKCLHRCHRKRSPGLTVVQHSFVSLVFPARCDLALVFCTFFFSLLSIVTGVTVVVAEHYDALSICLREALGRALRPHPVASQERFEFGRSLNLDIFAHTQQRVRCGGRKCPRKVYSVASAWF